jgi:hypothetical protein
MKDSGIADRSAKKPRSSVLSGTHAPAASLVQQSVPSTRIEDDFDGWLLSQAAALRGRQYFSLDVENLAEELEDMGALRREALRSNLVVVLVHMLKLACETRPSEKVRRERQWKLDLVEHRDRINDLLKESGTLRAEFETFKREAYERARTRAGLAIDPDQAPIGPEQCPWSTEQILADDFFPL